MSLDLGALVGRAIIDDGPFQRTYSRLMRQMADLGRAGERTAAGTAALDESLTATGKAATSAGAGIERTTRASTSAAAAEDKAAAAASRHAQAVAKVAVIMDETAATTPRVQSATLRLAAAQERLNELQASGTATTRQLTSAQAGLISAQRSLTAAQEAGAVASSRFRTGLASTLKMAAELGLLIGGIEIARKAIEFVAAGKHLTDALNSVQAASHATDREMLAVRAQAIALGRDLTVPRATAVDAAEAIDDLVRAGMTLPRAMGAARAALLLAAAANVKTADSARVLGDVLDEFKLPASEATKTANILAAAATSSAGGLMSVFEAFTYVGTRARALGLGVQDIAAAIIDLSKAGILGDRAGTGLAMMLQRLASESPKGQKALDDLGVTAWNAQGKFVGLPKVIDQLHAAQQRMGTGSQRFVKDVSDAFGARAANVVAAFALRGVEGYDTMYKRLSSGDVERAAALMNRGAGAGFRQLGKEATAAGIAAYDKFEKPLTSAVMWVGDKLPAAVSTAAHILGPFGTFLGSTLGTAWNLFIDGAKMVGTVLGPVVHLIDSLRTPLGAIGIATLGAYLGFKLFSAIPAIMNAVWSSITRIPGVVSEMAASVSGSVSTYVRSMAAIGASSEAAAVTATGAMGAIAEESAAMSGVIVAEGEAASIGWAGLLGPLGAVAIGVGLLVTMFHHSASASKEAVDAAKAFDTAVQAGDRSTLLDSIVKQLSDNDVPQKLAALNKALGSSTFTGKQFTTAIEQGGPALRALRSHLQSVVDAGDHMHASITRAGGSISGTISPASVQAKKLLGDLNTLSGALTKSQIKEIASYKALGMVAVSVDQVSAKLGLASGQVKTYAGMLGLAVTKEGDLVNATKANQQAILAVSHAYDTATQSGDLMLAADQAFSASAGTAADRATLIGATLKASNGDALAFAGSMTASTGAVDALTSAFKQQRDQLAQQSVDQQKAADGVSKAHRASATAAARVAAAEARLNQVRGSSKSTAAQIKAAEAAVTAAQNSAKNSADRLGEAQTAAGKAGALAYGDTERAAIKFKKTAHGLTATIDTNAKGAGDLVTQLQGIQDAAVKAAGAMFQHEGATKAAADDAYKLYVTKTKNALIDNRKELGLTLPQARALAKAYYDTPKSVKTLIEAEGTDPVVTVLNKIGRLLAYFTGQNWDAKVGVNDQASAKIRTIQRHINSLHGKKVIIDAITTVAGGGFNVQGGAGVQARAGGGTVYGPGGPKSDSVPLWASVGEEVMQMPYAAGWRPLLKAINSGTLGARMPALTASKAAATAGVAMRAGEVEATGGGRPIHVHGDLKVIAHYPEPEPVSKLTPRALRMARIPLDGL